MMLAFGHRLRVPDPADLPADGRRPDRRHAAVGPALRHRRHLRAGGRDHPVRRPDQHADALACRWCLFYEIVDHHRAASCERRKRAAADGRRRPESPRRASRSTLPGPGHRRPRRGPLGARRRADRLGQDRRGRARRRPRRSPRAARPSTRRRSRRCRTRSTPTWPAATAPHRVGLLTGDNAINGDAPVVVMTTEVLRNMIYAGSPALRDLRYVVLDEVHYLQDTYRGPVWEEVIIHLARACASCACRPPCPTPRSWPSGSPPCGAHRGGHRGAPAGRAAEPLPRRRQAAARSCTCSPPSSTAGPTPRPTGSTTRPCSARGGAAAGPAPPALLHPAPRRGDRAARGRGDAPGITFIFSRNACDDAATPASTPGCGSPRPTSGPASATIVDERTASLADADLDVLGFDRFLAGLEAGIAAHHAGMVPPFKEAVEACFVEGLTKVVFATETLALGINMPARSVVIERLTKFTGERHEMLTPGEYTQLTGRAGRRGHRRRRARRRAVVAVRALRAGGRAGLEPHLRAALGLPAHLQHGGQPRAALRAGPGPPPPQPVVRPVPGRPRRRAPRGPARAAAAAPRPPAGGGRRASAATSTSTGALRKAADGRGPAHRDRRADRRSIRSTPPWPALAPGRRAWCSAARATPCSASPTGRAQPGCTPSTSRASRRTLGADDLDEPPRAVGAGRPAGAVRPEQPGLPARGRPTRCAGGRASTAGRPRRAPPRSAPATATRSTRAARRAMAHPVADCPDRDAHLRAAVAGRPGRARARRPPPSGAGPHRVAGPPLRPGAAPPRGLGLPRRAGP